MLAAASTLNKRWTHCPAAKRTALTGELIAPPYAQPFGHVHADESHGQIPPAHAPYAEHVEPEPYAHPGQFTVATGPLLPKASKMLGFTAP